MLLRLADEFGVAVVITNEMMEKIDSDGRMVDWVGKLCLLKRIK